MKLNKLTSLISISLLMLSGHALAEKHDHNKAHEHKKEAHSHAHDDHDHDNPIAKGYFEDEQVKDRPLSNWAGDWQSVYPYLMDGTLNKVMLNKAKHGEKTMLEYKEYYEIGYKTDVNKIEINGENVTFTKDNESYTGNYVSDGYEILTYEKGNRGVRYIFKKASGDANAPGFIQFSDHIIAPQDSDHYHIYFGNDRAELLKEVTNWPTYFPATLTAKEVADAMFAH